MVVVEVMVVEDFKFDLLNRERREGVEKSCPDVGLS